MRKLLESLRSQPDDFAVLWVSVSTIMAPIAIFAGLVATYFVTPWDLVPSLSITDPISLLIVRSITFALVAGGIFETPRWLMLRRFSKFTYWIPATIVGLVVGMLIIQFQDDLIPVMTVVDDNFPTCLSFLPENLLYHWPLVLAGIAQSVVLAKENNKWIAWIVGGSLSYLFPLASFMACARSGFFLGSFIAALITLFALPITLEKKQ